jgi:hypothetical protein
VASGAVAAKGEPLEGAGQVAFVVSATAQMTVVLRESANRSVAALRSVLSQRAGKLKLDPEIEAIIAEEQVRGREFDRRSQERVAVRAAKIARLGSPEQREQAMATMWATERHYQELRAQAMAVRALAALGRVLLKRESPDGAFWKLDDSVIEHTRMCRFMGGKFWPWEVLNRVHPPRHNGCPCGLHSKATAVRRGWMKAEDVQDRLAAIRSSAWVVMEAEAGALAPLEEVTG